MLITSSGMWRHSLFTDVSEERTASIYRIEEQAEYFFWHIVPDHTVSRPSHRREDLEFPANVFSNLTTCM
jgi:hypothetical protein